MNSRNVVLGQSLAEFIEKMVLPNQNVGIRRQGQRLKTDALRFGSVKLNNDILSHGQPSAGVSGQNFFLPPFDIDLNKVNGRPVIFGNERRHDEPGGG